MKRIQDDYTAWRKETEEKLARLKSAEITVGVHGSAGGELLKIAAVHEFGATITPKNAKNLAIPLKPSMKNRSPRGIKNSFVLDNGENRFIARDKGKDQVELLFLLLPSVTIPARSYIRGAYDSGQDKLAQACRIAAEGVILGELSVEDAAQHIGVAAVSLVKRYMRSVMPKKSSLTLASSPGKGTTLVQSGQLQNAVSFEVKF